MFSTLVIAEHSAGQLSNNTRKVLGAAKQLNQEIDVVVTGHNLQPVIEDLKSKSCTKCIRRIYSADNKEYEHNLADHVSPLLIKLINEQEYKQVMMSGSSEGKDLLPYLAAKCNSQPLSEVVAMPKSKHFVRPTYAGNAFALYHSSQSIDFITIRNTAFQENIIECQQQVSDIQTLEVPQLNEEQQKRLSKFIKEEKIKSDKPQLSSAKVVISGGRGLKSKENFQLIEALADKLEGAVGASRAAVDAGYIGNDYQVGQTGKVVAPHLYIAVGISGAIQHLAGMKDSKVIVAINKDQEAPIFQIADYGLVADLFKALPELTNKL